MLELLARELLRYGARSTCYAGAHDDHGDDDGDVHLLLDGVHLLLAADGGGEGDDALLLKLLVALVAKFL